MKYTKDGKKVSVVANIDGNQYMVQEIFIDKHGNEFPDSKSFLVSELFDNPVLSWKESNLIKLNNGYDVECKKLNDKLTKMRADNILEQSNLCSLTRNIKDMSKALYCDKFQTLFDFIEGNIKYLVVSSYSKCEIVEFEASILNNSKYDVNGLKLISLFGGSGGDLQWRIHRYSDDSSGSQTIIPCKTYEQAVFTLDGLIEDQCAKMVSKSSIDAKEKYNLKNPTEQQVKEFNAKEVKALTDSLNSLEKTKSNIQLKIQDLMV